MKKKFSITECLAISIEWLVIGIVSFFLLFLPIFIVSKFGTLVFLALWIVFGIIGELIRIFPRWGGGYTLKNSIKDSIDVYIKDREARNFMFLMILLGIIGFTMTVVFTIESRRIDSKFTRLGK